MKFVMVKDVVGLSYTLNKPSKSFRILAFKDEVLNN